MVIMLCDECLPRLFKLKSNFKYQSLWFCENVSVLLLRNAARGGGEMLEKLGEGGATKNSVK